jgi:hypothetical protein
MALKNTLKSFRKEAEIFCNLHTLNDVATLFRIDKKELTLKAFEPMYYHFSVPKANGDMRHVEAPEDSLKKIQRKLNEYLQKVYYLHQSEAAYGYIPSVTGETNRKNIYTNAEKHLACRYMMNVDFEDFFHQISFEAAKKIFSASPFQFDKYTANTLAKICCYKERLPMGAPTSPVISNFYTLPLDKELSRRSKQEGVSYTRFVDDLTFSSKTTPFDITYFREIETIAYRHGLLFNQDKTKYCAPDDEKIITGLILKETVDIVPGFYQELEKDLQRLKAINEVMCITGKSGSLPMIRSFKQFLCLKMEIPAK